MLAPQDQLVRWTRLLGQPAKPEPADPAAVVDAVARSRGRAFLTGALAALELARTDETSIARLGASLPPLGPVPLRRPAAEGALVCDAVVGAYLQWRLGVPAAGPWLRAFVESLAPTALVFTANDNPEPWWQAEMVILHAAHSFALQQYPPDRPLLDRTLACADFHLREIQPDHATNEPWAVHAYASHDDGNVTAETLWHAAYIQHGGRPGPVAILLARDAAFALGVWLERTPAT